MGDDGTGTADTPDDALAEESIFSSAAVTAIQFFSGRVGQNPYKPQVSLRRQTLPDPWVSAEWVTGRRVEL